MLKSSLLFLSYILVVCARSRVSSCFGLGRSLVANQTPKIKRRIVKRPILKLLSWEITGWAKSTFILRPDDKILFFLSKFSQAIKRYMLLMTFLTIQTVISPKKVISL